MTGTSGASLDIEVQHSGIWQLSSVVLSTRGGGCWVIDPGYFPAELDALTQRAARHGPVDRVIFTHGHWDHVMGWRSFPGAAVLGSSSLAQAVADALPTARKNLDDARDFDGRWYVPREFGHEWPEKVTAVGDRETLHLGDAVVEAILLPGHSEDGLALWLRDQGVLIAGDYLSPCEIPFVEDLAAYQATLWRLLRLLPSVESIIPGHGPRQTSAGAIAIAQADAAYLEQLSACVASGDEIAAAAIPFPRASNVPGMREHHAENCRKAFARRAHAFAEKPASE